MEDRIQMSEGTSPESPDVGKALLTASSTLTMADIQEAADSDSYSRFESLARTIVTAKH